MNLRVMALILGAALTAMAQSTGPSAPARPRPSVAWWENPVGNGLTLTEEQKHRIGHIVREHRDSLALKRQEAERAERELETVFDADAVDLQRGKVVTDQLVKARGELTQEMVRMTLRLRAVLTLDQWKTLQDRDANLREPKSAGRRSEPKSGIAPHSHDLH